jgi:hypothetical protein
MLESSRVFPNGCFRQMSSVNRRKIVMSARTS